MRSMTGFAAHAHSVEVAGQAYEVEWDIRAVNGRGLDLRLRVPETIGFIEKSIRDLVAAQVARGNVGLSLKLRAAQAPSAAPLDPQALEALLAALDHVNGAAQARGILLQAPSALDLLGWRGVLQTGPDSATFDQAALGPVILESLRALLLAFNTMRAQEGATLSAILSAQLDQIAQAVAQARALLPDRARAQAEALTRALAATTAQTRADPARLEQELALIAVKSDVTEELDRLDAHVATARALLSDPQPVGRKLDFLMQEFNREANTLCSKAQYLDLTRIGLELKTVIDQMREQVQNLE
ncbi:MAG: YicC/YloC family endoribonuclease [Roseinatronobacter sp.]